MADCTLASRAAPFLLIFCLGIPSPASAQPLLEFVGADTATIDGASPAAILPSMNEFLAKVVTKQSTAFQKREFRFTLGTPNPALCFIKAKATGTKGLEFVAWREGPCAVREILAFCTDSIQHFAASLKGDKPPDAKQLFVSSQPQIALVYVDKNPAGISPAGLDGLVHRR